MNDYFKLRAPLTKANLSRFNVTGREEDRYKFKVPGLRKLAKTAPYFHDGSASTLDEPVRMMSKAQIGRPVTEDHIRSIVAFLESLSGEVDKGLL